MRDKYQAAMRDISADDARTKATKDRIYERDRQFWNAVASRGGSVETSLCEGAQIAMANFERRRQGTIDAIARPVLDAAEKQLAGLRERGATAAREFLDVFAAIARAEHERNEFLRRIGRDEVPTIAANRDPHAGAFVDRVGRALTPPAAARPVARQPLAIPAFEDLAAS